MKHIQEFERFATSYQQYKIIQSKVAHHLVTHIPKKAKFIADLGAGSGEVYKAIDWDFERLYAIDSSAAMLSLHPTKKVKKIVCDFDSKECFEKLRHFPLDMVIASSSLQWSKDLPKLFYTISSLSSSFYGALFSANTFKTLHAMLQLSSPIYTTEEILYNVKKYFMVDYEVREYKLFFPEKKDMFTYIKRSGVSAGKKRTSIAALRQAMREYPYNYLEFEVIFLWCEK